MIYATSSGLAVVFVIILMSLFIIWSRKETVYRFLSIIIAVMALPFAAVNLAFTLGWAVPAFPMITAPPGEYDILGAKIIDQKAIYLFLDTGNEPRNYMMFWDQKFANDLQKALNRNLEGLQLLIPYEFSWNTNKNKLKELPPPKFLPDKPNQRPNKNTPSFEA